MAESSPPEARKKRRESVGKSSGETFVDTLKRLAPGAECDQVKPADHCSELPTGQEIRTYDAVFLTGSPLHLWQDSDEVRREIAFMRAVFASNTPSFGSCAGLQLAAVAAGGTVRPIGERREAGFARRITSNEAGRKHPLLQGRPPAWDAPAFHTDEVETLPADSVVLASNEATRVQAAEIRHGGGVFWGVQYHPEISLFEIAGALRRQASDLIEKGLARSEADVESFAKVVDELAGDPHRRDLQWRLGLSEDVTAPEKRTLELSNFIEHLVKPTMSQRQRG
ncbi:type 1 glutamine amidotransferase [Altericroceibacterium xinjiangense]|uniref:type 1 glutamine amidotransferase n=1 Tax=Altericroceibacterium xinjiangense TaxID=762261 RepID=UPI001F498816|nr:type 1 glutamine amidotransferase [Altericroceibacterium xinjiangense]